MTALAGLIGAAVGAYKLLKPSPPAEPEPEPGKPQFEPLHDDRAEHIRDLREALGECRQTVHALRQRLDQATRLDQRSLERGPQPGSDWLSGS